MGQKVAILLGLVALAVGFTVAPVITIVALNGALVVFYIASNSMKVFLINRALNDPRRVSVHAASDRVPDDELPVYTILLPVYREAALLVQLVDGIQALDYPNHRLDVKLLLEEEDVETRDAAADMDLPDCFDVSVVPAVGPTGKPRACNHGLANARGEYLVIFDAEDRPEAGPAPQVGPRLQGIVTRSGLPAGPAQLFQPDTQPADPLVHCRILGVVRSTASRSSGDGCRHSAGGHVQSLHHGETARDRRVECLQRDRGRRPRPADLPARLEDRHPRDHHLRGGDQPLPELDPPAEPMG